MMAMQRAHSLAPPRERLDCDVPIDSQSFDDARFAALPEIGSTALLARIELPPQYCGTLEYFAQFTDLFGREPAEIETPGLRWQIVANGEPLSPYHDFAAILNPWGHGSFQFRLRLPEAASVEFRVRRVGESASRSGKPIDTVGGRLMGRYWYNEAYGGAR